MGSLTGAPHGEKNPERLAQRDGCRDRDWGEARPAAGSWGAGRTGQAPWSVRSPKLREGISNSRSLPRT